jgi:large subunit ribosomal protein L5
MTKTIEGKLIKNKMDKNNEMTHATPSLARLETFFKEKVTPNLIERFQYKNVMLVPRLEKISINIGVGAAAAEPKLLEIAVQELALITGQKPQLRKSKKAISNFKLREGQPIGCRVTLRRKAMYEFFDRFVSLAVPRIRDFRGLSDTSFDGRGNYTVGVREQIIFPEIDIDKVPRISGMDISFVTSASTDEEAYTLLSELGMPFKKKNN